MLKKLSFFTCILPLIFALASCKSTPKGADNFKVEDQAAIDNQVIEEQPYQAVENEQQAKALNEGQIETIKEVEVQDRVFYGYNSSEVDDAAQAILNTQAEWLKNSPAVKVTIEGHCDERGTREYNIALGEKRALSAKNYLVKNGVEAARIQIISYGKERPAYFGASEDIFAKNRRAVVVPN